ncbi:hypothetical protein DVH05_022203 [Phytophthora capsici]|nr:hypothetical protein DVH05_022203 [Phytophthora capsici]
MIVTVTDVSEDKLSASQSFKLEITDVNEPPKIMVPTPVHMSIPENTPNGSLVGSPLVIYFSDEDFGDTMVMELISSVPLNGVFSMTSLGQLSVQNAGLLDFESRTLIQISCRASDTGGLTVDFLVNIDISNVNEAPYFLDTVVQINIPESTVTGTQVYQVRALDPDGYMADIRYYIIGNDSNPAFVMSEVGIVTSSQKLGTSEVFSIIIEAVDDNGNGLPSLTNQRLIITVTSVNSPPTVSEFLFYVDENNEYGAKLGQVFGMDDYAGSVLTFFTIPDTDRIRFHATGKSTSDVYLWSSLDFEKEPNITFVLCALDDGAKNDYVAVMQGCGKLTIAVGDVNEPPKFENSGQSARTMRESAQLDDGISENVHYINSGGKFFGNISHNLLSDVGMDGKLNISSSSVVVQGTKILTDGLWHYLAIIYTISDHTLRLYVEGVLDSTTLVKLGSPTIAQQAVLSSDTSMFTGWISRFHYFAGAISLSEVQELLSLSVPSFYVVTDASNGPVTHKNGTTYCHNLGLRLCDLMDLDSLCVNPHNNLSIFPSASQGQMIVPHCLNTASKAEQNAGNAQVACCSPFTDSKLIGNVSRPILRATALTASSFLNNSRRHGFGYGGLNVLRSGNVDGSWCPASNSPSEWIQISFPKATVISRIQCVPGFDANGNTGYLKKFQVAWRRSSSEEFSILSQTSGAAITFIVPDSNSESQATSVVIPNILAKDFRVIPTAWLGSACMRLEIYGLDSDFEIAGPLLAHDTDANDQLQYNLRDSDRPSGVQIDAFSGSLTVRRRWIDFEMDSILRFTVDVYDTFGLNDSITTAITILDANDAPLYERRPYVVAENPTKGTTLVNRGSKMLVVEDTGMFNFEDSALVRCPILITDDSALQRSIYATVQIQVTDVNEVPIIVGGQRGYIMENATTADLVMTIKAMDPDKIPPWSSLRYELLSTDIFSVNSSTGNVSVLTPGVLDFETNSELTLVAQVTDGGFLTAQAFIFVSILNTEEAPVVPSENSIIIPENGAVPRSILLVNAVDPDRSSTDELSFSLVENAHAFAIDETIGDLVLIKALNYEDTRSLRVVVNVAKRGTDLTTNSTFFIHVEDINEPPELYTGMAVEVAAFENMQYGLPIGASMSSYVWDPENDTLTYVLEPSEYSPYFTLDGCVGQLQSNLPLDFEAVNGKVSLDVSVYDTSKAQLRFVVLVSLADVNEPPVFSQSEYELAIAENATPGNLVGAMVASDPDAGNTLKYSVKASVDSTSFSIHPKTGEIFVSSIAELDYETQRLYNIEICASDCFLETCKWLRIKLIDVNEPPLCRSETRYVAENSASGTTVTPPLTSSDLDEKDVGLYPRYFLVDSEHENGFRFSNASIVVQDVALDYEVQNMYRFQFSVCDAGNGCTVCNLTIHVVDINEPPMVLNQIAEIMEGTTGACFTFQAYDPDLNQTGSLTYEILGQSIPGVFSVGSRNGLIQVVDPFALDYEKVELHQAWINIRVTDTGTPSLASTGQLLVNIIDVNEAPTSDEIIDLLIPEDTIVGETVLMWAVFDEDLVQELTFQIVGDIQPYIVSFRDTLKPVLTLESALNYEMLAKYEIVLQACDPYTLCTTSRLRILVQDRNEPPSLLPNTGTGFEFSVGSHALPGTVIGVLQAVDPDYADIMSFSLQSAAHVLPNGTKSGAGIFSVNQVTGELKVGSSQSIQQLQAGYKFLVTAKVTDLNQLSSATTIIISVVDNNAQPVCQKGLRFYLDENAAIGTSVGVPLSTYVTDADDGTTFLFSLQHPFLSANPTTGQLFVTDAANLDFESSSLNSTSATVLVTDDGAYHNGINTLSTSCVVFIEAVDANEIPTTSNIALSIQEGINSNPFTAQQSEVYTFPILSSRSDYTVTKKASGGYTVDIFSKTLPLGYDPMVQTSVGIVLRFEGVHLPEAIIHLSQARLRFTVPTGKIGPFSLQLRVINSSSTTWNYNEPLEKIAFVEWTVENELSAAVISSPNIASIIWPVMAGILKTDTLTLLIHGGGIGEIGAFDRGVDNAAVLEVAITQGFGVSVGAAVPFSDPDFNDNVHFEIVKGNPPNPVFFVDKITGDITAILELLDYESQQEYELLISVTDKLGLVALSAVTITVLDVNEPPILDSKVCYVPENAEAGTKICSITGSDPDGPMLATGTLTYYLQSTTVQSTAFQIDPISGTLLVANATALNYEVQQQVSVNVCVRDGGNPFSSACGVITIFVTDEDDVPTTILPQACQLDEYSYNLNDEQLGQLVGTVVCNLSVNDEDSSGSHNVSWKTHVWNAVDLEFGNPFTISSHGNVLATDLGGLSSPLQRIQIIITDINESPQMTPSTFYIDENSLPSEVASGDFNVVDPDIRDDGGPDTVIVTLPSYSLSVVATDTSGARSSIERVRIVVNDINEVPLIDTVQLLISENQPVRTNIFPAISAKDPDGSSVLYSLVSETPRGSGGRSPTAFGIDSKTGIVFQNVYSLDYEDVEEYDLVVKAQDSTGLFSTAIITVKITDANESPRINDQIVSIREDAKLGSLVGQAFTLFATDPDLKNGYEVLSFVLLQDHQSMFTIDPKTGQVTTAGLLDFETDYHYNLRVRVTDVNGLSGDADLIITVIDVNEPPFISAFNFSVPEDLIPGSTIGSPILALDWDKDASLVYDIVGTSDHVMACIGIHSYTGQLVLNVNCALDYESSFGNTLPIVVRVWDGEFTVSARGVVYVTDVNESPILAASMPSLLRENSPIATVVSIIFVEDPDSNESLQFSICEQSNLNAFKIQATGLNTAEITVNDSAVINFEKFPSLWVDVCVTDKGMLSARSRYIVNLINVFEPPYFAQQLIAFAIEESNTIATKVGYPLSRYIIDEEHLDIFVGCTVDFSIVNNTCSRGVTFILDGCGQIVLGSGSLDFETMSACVIYVTLPTTRVYNMNNSGSSLVDTVTVVLNVIDINEPPTFSQNVYQFGVSEDAAIGTVIGYLSGTDVDTGDTISFHLLNSGGEDKGAFVVSPLGTITLQKSLDFEVKHSYQLSVRVIDNHAAFSDGNVTITVTDSNEPPVFRTSAYSFSIEENALPNTAIGSVTAIDSDLYQNKTISYNIVYGNDLGAFGVLSIAGDGTVVVASQQALDFERQQQYSLIISATDSGPGGLSSFVTVVVNITDINEGPSTSPLTLYIPEDAIIATALCTSIALNQRFTGVVFASDPDNDDMLTFTILDATDTFAIDPATGVTVAIYHQRQL